MFEFEDIYQTMIGSDENPFAVDWVKPINVYGSGYALAREEFLHACESLCDRLGCLPFGDGDIETVMESVGRMQKEVAYGMFLCGIEYKGRTEK